MTGLTKRGMFAGAAALAFGGGAPESAAARSTLRPHGKTQPEPASVQGADLPERSAFTAQEAAAARPEGIAETIRIAGDDAGAFRRLIASAASATDPWLVLSGGGENGAFAAGLLSGWSQAGNRPRFGVVTGVSTGALIAPFAFVGAGADPVLRANYTEISAADVFEFGATPEALTDTWPLKERIGRGVTPHLLAAVAAEHERGRRLLIATTQVDAERPVLWDMGAIARLGGERGLRLFQAIVLASTAVPGVFPPVLIPADGQDGRMFSEMHDDGGTMAPFFLAPEAAILGTPDAAGLRLPARTVYLVVNNRLTPEFEMARRTTLSVLGRTMSAAIKAQTRAALALSQGFAVRTGLDLRVATIDDRFTRTSPAPFDRDYMRALYAHGEALGRAGTAFSMEPAAPGTPAADAATGIPPRRPTLPVDGRDYAAR